MAADEGEDSVGLRSGILNDEVAAVGVVGDVIDNERAAVGCREWKKVVNDVLNYPVLLRNQLRRVVLEVFGFSDEFAEERNE